MSLLQEALRRKDEENLGLPPKVIPFVEPSRRRFPAPEPKISEKPLVLPPPARKSRAWPVLMISLLILVLSLVAVGLLLDSARSLIQREPPAKTPALPPPLESSIFTDMVKKVSMEKKEVSMEKQTAPTEIIVRTLSPPIELPLSWPKLKVIGVMGRTDIQDVAAIVDGNLMECGEEIHGVKVQKVDNSGVWFVFKNETQFVRVGQTTL